MNAKKQKLDAYNDPRFLIFLEENTHAHQLESSWQIDRDFDEFLDSCYGEVEIMGYTYTTSEALKSTDPTAYRCALADYISEEYVEITAALANGDEAYLRKDIYEELEAEFEEYLELNNGEV